MTSGPWWIAYRYKLAASKLYFQSETQFAEKIAQLVCGGSCIYRSVASEQLPRLRLAMNVIARERRDVDNTGTEIRIAVFMEASL
jgi:hypothetical protein